MARLTLEQQELQAECLPTTRDRIPGLRAVVLAGHRPSQPGSEETLTSSARASMHSQSCTQRIRVANSGIAGARIGALG
jgi:hypothetical protein